MTSEPAPTKKRALTPQERSRRRARRAWIPTIVIGALVVAVLATAIILQTSGVFSITTGPHGDSKFDIAGLKVINGSAAVQIDVRKPLSATSVGLPANSSRTFGPYGEVQLELDLIGTHGTKSIFVDSMHVITRHGRVVSVSTSTTNSGYLFIRNQLASLGVLGLTTRQMANFEDEMPNGAGDEHSHFSLPFGTGDALGVPTAVTVSCDGARGCTVSTKTTLLTK